MLLVSILSLFVCLEFFVPLRTAIKIGADEDWELSKATLALKGYHFYTEVWNDQPLLHTFIIKNVLKYISPSVLGPRLVTSGFSVLLLAGLFFICLRINGVLVATLAAVLLIASPGFMELSSSCMVEIPALSPAVAGLAILMGSRFKGQRSRSEVSETESPPSPRPSPPGEGAASTRFWRHWRFGPIIAGMLFGISSQIKFINVVLLPIAALIIWLRIRISRDSKADSTLCQDTSPQALSPERRGSRSVELRDGPPHPKSFPTRTTPPTERERCDAPAFIKSLLIFGSSLVVTFLAITFATGAEGYWLQLKQSWAAHFASTKSYEYGSPADHPFEWSTYLKNWDTTIPAIIGIFVCLRTVRSPSRLRGPRTAPSPWPSPPMGERENPQAPQSEEGALLLIPVVWFALEFVVFGFHKPWWSYYYIHNAVPLCWCAAIGIVAVVQTIGFRDSPNARSLGLPLLDRGEGTREKPMPRPSFARRRRIPAVVLASLCGLVLAGWMGARVYLQISTIRSSPKIHSALVIKEVERYKPFTKFIYTDEPAYSFHTGIPMPPSLAVVTLKRLWSGDMTNARLVEELRLSKPGVLLLKNQTAELPFSDWMQSEYRLVYQDAKHNLYAHKEIVGKVKW